MKWKSLGIVLICFNDIFMGQNVICGCIMVISSAFLRAKCDIWVRLNIGDASRRPLDSGFFTGCGWNGMRPWQEIDIPMMIHKCRVLGQQMIEY